VRFRGTYREEGWRRCGMMTAADGIRFTPWPHDELPGWSLPALEAAKCAAKQGDEAFTRVHHALYEAFFTHSRNIADGAEVIRIVAGCGIDVDRFVADYEAGAGREAVVADYEAAHTEHGVRSIPTVIVPATGRALVGLADLAQYRHAVEEAAR
jgi:predicted DsbA family dithiol-disulfide isomerase